MKIGLWIVQVLLALAFLGAGFMKLTAPIDELVANGMLFAGDIPVFAVRFAGLAELLGAIGLILPAATRTLPVLTPAAASGLVTVMVLAVALHISRGGLPMIAPNIVLGSLAAFVAWGRFKKLPIEPR